MSKIEIGCCGAYCKTCTELTPKGKCKGCKLGYDSGERDITKAKCKIKLCCFKEKQLCTCADCPDHLQCDLLNTRFKPGTYQNKKIAEILAYIDEQGYDAFEQKAISWTSAYGRLKEKKKKL